MKRETSTLLFLLALAAVLFATHLGGYDLWPPDEPRFAQVAREMMQSGDYLVPHINGEPYKEKPPLLFWSIAALSQPFGDVNEITTRIPSVVSALIAVLFTFLLARSLYGPRVAFWAALILITTQRFWWQSRFGQIDMLLAACLTVSLYAFWRWHETRRAPWLAAFYLAAAAGLYAKGPGTLVFPVLLAISFYWRDKSQWRAMYPILGAAAIALFYAVWLVPARMGAAAEAGAATSHTISSDLFRQTIGRFVFGVSHANPPWYYFETLPVDWLPWALFLPWTLPWVWRRRKEGPEMRLLLCWTLPAFIFFSIALGKRAIYLLPLSPALAIFFARSVLDLMDSDRVRWRRRTGLVWCAGLVLLAVAPQALLLSKYKDAWTPGLAVFSLLAAACAVHAGLTSLRREARQLHAAMAGHFAVLALAVATVIFPAVNPHKSVEPLCAPVRHLVESGERLELYSVGFTREEYIFYTRHFHKPVFTDMLDLSLGDLDVMAQAKQLSKLHDAIGDEVEDVPVADFHNLSNAEIQALSEALDRAFETAPGDPAVRQAFKTALTAKVAEFFTTFTGPTPAFMFVQEDDWRWMLALEPRWHDQVVLHGQQAGSREVLLIANPAGASLLSKETKADL